MSYHGTNYRMGRGDPGFFSFIGKALNAVGNIATGGLLGTAENAIGGIVGALGGGGHSPQMMRAAIAPRPPLMFGLGSGIGVGDDFGGGDDGITMMGGMGMGMGMGGMIHIPIPSLGKGGVAPRGYHLSKPRKGHPSHLVRNRHMNWANGKALSRAERRVHRFVKHAQRLVRWVHPHKTGRAVPKFGRKRK